MFLGKRIIITCSHNSFIYISASAPLPTVHGWDGLLWSRCLCLGSLSNVLSKLLKVGRLSGSNAQQTVRVSWGKKPNKFILYTVYNVHHIHFPSQMYMNVLPTYEGSLSSVQLEPETWKSWFQILLKLKKSCRLYNFSVFECYPKVCRPFKWKLLSSTFLWHCLLCCTRWF